MRPRPPLRRFPGDPFLRPKSAAERTAIRRKLDADQRSRPIGLVARRLLPCLAGLHPALVWRHFGSGRCTVRSLGCASEFVVACAPRPAPPPPGISRCFPGYYVLRALPPPTLRPPTYRGHLLRRLNTTSGCGTLVSWNGPVGRISRSRALASPLVPSARTKRCWRLARRSVAAMGANAEDGAGGEGADESAEKFRRGRDGRRGRCGGGGGGRGGDGQAGFVGEGGGDGCGRPGRNWGRVRGHSCGRGTKQD